MLSNSEKIRAIAVDDEQHAIELLKGVLGLFPNEIEIVAEANSLPEAINKINEQQPDVVFMDIDMPKYSGIQIADFFDEERKFELVFVTAHGQYAIDALRITAFDYLLKPIDIAALEKCYQRLLKKQMSKNTKPIDSENPVGLPSKLAVNSHQGTQYINQDEILFLEASSVYTVLHLENGEQVVVSKPMGEIHKSLNNYFYRTHRSFVVNAKHIIKYSGKEGSEVELSDGKKVPVSRNIKDDLKRFMLGNFSKRN